MTLASLTSLIPVLTPIVIAAAKWAVPQIPKVALPVVAPVLGAALDIAAYYAGVTATADPARGALLGAAGVWVREVIDQVKKVGA